MVSTLKKKHQNKRFLGQLTETLGDLNIGKDANADAIVSEILGFLVVLLLIWSGRQSVKTVQVTIKSFREFLPRQSRKRLMTLLQLSKIESMTRFWEQWITL